MSKPDCCTRARAVLAWTAKSALIGAAVVYVGIWAFVAYIWDRPLFLAVLSVSLPLLWGIWIAVKEREHLKEMEGKIDEVLRRLPEEPPQSPEEADGL